MTSQLTPLQQTVLELFFDQERRFFLTGGGALCGFYLGHRVTLDLDLFVTEDVLAEGVSHLRAITQKLSGSLESIQTSPDFRRFLLRALGDTLVIDLVRDRSPQLFPKQTIVSGIRLDSVEEIFANKLCALLSRSEIRDLVDLRALEETGLSLQAMVLKAERKDAGLTPGQLGWVLSQIQIGEDAQPPGNVTGNELREYLKLTVMKLSAMSFPKV